MALTKVQIDGVEFSDSTDLNVDNGTLVVDSSTNRVGVGTTSPVTTLHIQQSAVTSAPSRLSALYLENNANCEIQFVGNSSNNCQLRFGTSSNSFKGALEYELDNNNLISYVNGSERLRIDSSGRLLVGTSNSRSVDNEKILQIEGVTQQSSSMSLTRNTNSGAPPNISFGKSRGSTLGSNTIVQNGDSLGTIVFCGADGSDTDSRAANITCQVDGTPGANDMPGRLVFSTTADGASSPTERMRITSSGTIQLYAATNGSNQTIQFGDPDADARGLIQYRHGTDALHIYTAGSQAAMIDSSGRLLVGTTSGTESVHVNGAIASVGTSSSFSGGAKRAFFDYNGGANRARIGVTSGANNAAQAISFHTSPSGSAPGSVERFRFGPNGEFGIGGDTYGSSGQVLTSQGSGSAPQWATAAGGILQTVQHTTTSQINGTIGTTNGAAPTSTSGTQYTSFTFTPQSASSTLLLMSSTLAIGETSNNADVLWAGAWAGTTRIIVNHTGLDYARFANNYNSFWTTLTGQISSWGTSQRTISIRVGSGGTAGSSKAVNIDVGANSQSNGARDVKFIMMEIA